MDLYAKGQLSYLILNCLLERDFYGLDIISEISDRSNGKINLKKPSVYSNLTRMEKQGFVSAYLKSSDLGPNRKYYSITEKGRNFFKELNEYYERNNIDVIRDFSDLESQEKPTQTTFDLPEENIEETPVVESPANEPETEETEEVSESQEDYFDFSSIDEEENEEEKLQQTVAENNNHFEEYINQKVFIDEPKEDKQEETEPEEEQIEEPVEEIKPEEEHAETEENDETDDGVFLSQEKPEEYNQRIYDISKDINRYKKKKSFAEDQISITVNSPLSASEQKTNQSIQSFRESLEEDKSKSEAERISQYDFSKQMENRFSATNEEVKDDAKYITDRIEVAQKARKIAPPRLKIVEDVSMKEDRLPPPKRDRSIDPSHKEILSRLYLKTKDGSTNVVREDAIYDYVDLKDYYNGQNIAFSEYKKPVQKLTHNTNKLYFILSLFTFLMSCIVSALTYIALRYTYQLNVATNFLFIVLPALLILDIVWKFYNFKIYSSWFPKQMLAPWKIWLITVGLVGAVIGLNAIWGLGTAVFATYATTLLLPILLILILVPVRYYIKRFMLVKYWR